MFSLRMDAFGLALSPGGGRTVLYFGLIFLLVMGFSGIQISRAKLLDLMQGGRKNEELRPAPSGPLCSSWSWAGCALRRPTPFCSPLGWPSPGAPLPVRSHADSGGQWAPCWSFLPLSGFVLRLARSHPGFYYRDLHLFTLRQWISRVHSTYLSQTVICILLLLAMGITASSIGLNRTIEAAADGQAL